MSNDGGPAFPRSLTTLQASAHSSERDYRGMSLRDWFAGQALMMIMQWSHNKFPIPKADEIASSAWEIADAMLAERERK